MIKKDFKPKRKLWKKLSALLLPAVMIAVTPHAARMEVRADVSALASSYNSDVSYIAYASEVEDQSQTNYCWAYMADAVLESYLMKTGAVSHADLSERDMISQLTSGSYAVTDLYSGACVLAEGAAVRAAPGAGRQHNRLLCQRNGRAWKV